MRVASFVEAVDAVLLRWRLSGALGREPALLHHQPHEDRLRLTAVYVMDAACLWI